MSEIYYNSLNTNREPPWLARRSYHCRYNPYSQKFSQCSLRSYSQPDSSALTVLVLLGLGSFHLVQGEPGDSGGHQLHGSSSRRPAIRLHLRRDQGQESPHIPINGRQEGLATEVLLGFLRQFSLLGR